MGTDSSQNRYNASSFGKLLQTAKLMVKLKGADFVPMILRNVVYGPTLALLWTCYFLVPDLELSNQNLWS